MAIYIIHYGTRMEAGLHFIYKHCYSTRAIAEKEMAELKIHHENQGGDWYVPNFYYIEAILLDK